MKTLVTKGGVLLVHVPWRHLCRNRMVETDGRPQNGLRIRDRRSPRRDRRDSRGVRRLQGDQAFRQGGLAASSADSNGVGGGEVNVEYVRGHRMVGTDGRPQNGLRIRRRGSSPRDRSDPRRLCRLQGHQEVRKGGLAGLHRLVLLALAVCLLTGSLLAGSAVVRASSAQAYVGESFVQSGASLTEEAEHLVEVPDFIPKVWEGGGGIPPEEDVSAWTAFWESSGLFPILGGVLAFGAGAGVGSVICNEVLELEGCWFYGSEGGDTVETAAEGSWVWEDEPGEAGPTGHKVSYPSYVFLRQGKAGGTYAAYNQYSKTCLWGTLSAASVIYDTGATSECSSGEHEVRKLEVAIRYGTTDRQLQGMSKAEAEGYEHYTGKGYCPLAGPESLSCGYNPKPNWPERAVTCLNEPSVCGLTETQRDEIGEHIAANTPSGIKGGVHDPWLSEVEVPAECEVWGLRSTCVEKLEELELVPKVTELDWESAVVKELDLVEPETTREDDANRVVEVVPPVGNNVEVGTEIGLDVNPSYSDMPEYNPEPKTHEKYSEYIARLSPSFNATRETVGETNEDTSAGPDAVLKVAPDPGERVDPNVTTDTQVQTNPHDVPVAAVSLGSCNTEVGSVNFEPLNKDLGSKFPFGIVAFFAGWVQEWETEFADPEFSVHIPHAGTIHVSFSWLDEYITPMRVVLIFASFIGMLWFLGTAALKIQGDASE